MEMTEGVVCPDETKSNLIAPLQAVRPPNSVLCVQESGSWFFDPACSAIMRPSFEESSGERRLIPVRRSEGQRVSTDRVPQAILHTF